MRALSVVLGGVALGVAFFTARGLTAGEPAFPTAFKVVVHPSNPASHLSRAELADIYLGNKTRWAAGGSVEPFDQSATSPLRRDFSAEVLRMPVAEVVRHWQRLVFSGRGVPPRVKLSDAEVVSQVAASPSAIGYVSASADTAALKVLPLD